MTKAEKWALGLQLLWIIPLTASIFLVAASCVVSPSDELTAGHCYRVDRREGILALAGLRNVEIPCPVNAS